MITPEYSYWAKVIRWVDGDTLEAAVDVGFYLTAGLRLRVLGLNTPERGEPNWAEATAFGKAFAPVDTVLAIRTHKSDSFGRWLAEIERDGRSYTAEVISMNLGVPYKRK